MELEDFIYNFTSEDKRKETAKLITTGEDEGKEERFVHYVSKCFEFALQNFVDQLCRLQRENCLSACPVEMDKRYYDDVLDAEQPKLEDIMTKNINFNLKTHIAEVKNIEAKLMTLSPYAPLSRGYSILMKDDKMISNDISLSEFKTFDIIRKNEKVTAIFDKIIAK